MTHRTKAVRAGEKALRAALAKALKAIGRQCAKAVTAHLGKVAKAGRDDEREARATSDAAIEAADWSPVAQDSQTQLGEVAKDGAKRALTSLSVDDEGITDQTFDDAVEWATARAAELVGKSWDEDGNLVDNPDADMAITDTLREEIRGAVADALAEGLSAADLGDNIEGLSGFSPERADLIAKSEIIRANAQGQMTAMRNSGVVEQKAWSTSEDGDTCEDCEGNADEGDVDLEDDFPSGDDAPPAHPGCRCVVVAVIRDESESNGEGSDDGDDDTQDEAAE